MKLAFSTNAYINGKFTLIDAINEIADAGFRGVEILAENPLLWPFDITSKQIKEINLTLEKRNIKAVNLNACVCATFWKAGFEKIGEQKGNFSRDVFGPCFCDYEKENRELRIKYMKKVIDLTVEFGARDISTLSGFSPLRGTRKTALENMTDALKKVVEYAEKKEVRINLEYEPGLLIGSAEEAMEIIEKINSQNIGQNFDIGHSFVAEGDVIKTIKKIKDKIHNVHIEDIGIDEKGRPVHYHLIPGQGAMPLKDIISTLKNTGFNGWYIVELYTYYEQPVFATQESAKYMKKLAKDKSLKEAQNERKKQNS